MRHARALDDGTFHVRPLRNHPTSARGGVARPWALDDLRQR